MANRFPLVLDTTDNNKIKEIQTGDNLNLADNSIVGVQNITALGTIDAADIKVNGNRLVAQAFADLTDTPASFAGSPNYFVKVKPDGTGLEYRPLADLGNIEIDTITVDTSIVPSVHQSGSIGTPAARFDNVYATSLYGNLRGYNDEIVFDAFTAKISYAALQGAPTFLSEFTDDVGYLQTTDLDTTLAGLFDDGVPFTTDIVGSVFGDDSTVLVDGVNSIITGDVLNSQITTTGIVATTAQISTISTNDIVGTSSGDLAIDSGVNGIVNIGFGGATTAVNIKHAVIETFDQGSGLGIAQITASTDLVIEAANRVKVDGGVPFRFSSTTTANQLAIAAQEGDVIYNTTTSRLQMYQGSAWKDINGNVEATAGTSNFNDVVIAGNLTITGDATQLETTNTTITDNVIILNQGETGAGVTLGTSGIEIERGTETNKTFVWNETTDKWTVGAETFVAATVEATTLTDGSINITAGNLTGAAQITATTFVGNVTGNVTGNAAGAHTGTFDGDMTGTMSGDDSTILVDGNNNKIVGPVETYNLRTTNPTIALGYLAGQTDQEATSVAIGSQAGNNAQATGAVGIGYKAGNNTQGLGAVALGYQSGQNTQGGNAIAIGELAGQATQGGHGIALGYATGQTAQGESAIAIGKLAGYANQAANSIVINATGVETNNTTASSTVIQPVRNQASANVMMYDPTLGELTHTATPGTLAANIDQATLAIGAATATTIGIGNAASTTTISGILSVPAVVSGNITADNSMSITTATGDGNVISIGPTGTNTGVNLTADVIRISGDVILPIVAKAGVVGDLKGSVVGDDSTVLIDGVAGKIVGDIESTNIAGTTITASTTIKASTITNLTGTDDIAVNAAGFININAGTDDAGMSKIQMDQAGINHIEITTVPKVPGNAADVANVAINATAESGDVVIGTSGSTRNQAVTIHNATVTGTLVGGANGSHTGLLTGDVVGSVFGDDSSVIIDGLAGKVIGPISRIVGDVQQISGPGAISLDALVTEITTTGADAYTLADGVVGQIKIIAMIVDGGDATLTPTTLATGTTITFSDINDNISLLYTTNGWLNTANQNATIA
jgi:hypothetical protein